MANTADVIVLSSSPNRPRSPARIAPDQARESIALLRSTTPPPPPATKAKPVKPPTRSRFFATEGGADTHAESTKQSNKRVTKNAIASIGQDEGTASKPQQKAKRSTKKPASTEPGDSQAEDANTEANAPKQTKGRPRKTTKNKASANMTLAGKVTKTSGDLPPKTATKRTRKTTKTDSQTLDEEKERPALEESNALGKDEVLHLDEALRRRLDWTPPRETLCDGLTSASDGKSQDEGIAGSNVTLGFGNLLSDYNYSGNALNPRDLIQNSISEAPTKRRRIDLVDPLVQSLLNGKPDSLEQTPPHGHGVAGKTKKTANNKPKKFTTLTARMTAQYAINDGDEDEAPVEWAPEIKATKGKRSKAKEAAEDSRFTILSPEAAVEFVNDQDLVFGTCSQLEREDSPETLQEMQQAIRASETLAYSEGISNPNESSAADAMQTPSARSVSKLTGSRNLWCVASRDTEGSLIQSTAQNVIDLTHQIESPLNGPENVKQALHKTLPDNWYEQTFTDIDFTPEKKGLSATMSEGGSTSTKSTSTKSTSTKESQASLSSHPPAPAPAPAGDGKSKATKSTTKAGSNPANTVKDQAAGQEAPPMPQYNGFTDTELSKQVATFGFKAVRGRKKMIELLQQCWESKHGNNTSGCENIDQTGEGKAPIPQIPDISKSTSVPKPNTKAKNHATTAVADKSPRTKKTVPQSRTSTQPSPKKDSRVQIKPNSFIDIEEIQDSEEEITPSPSRVQKYHNDITSRNQAGNGAAKYSLDVLTKTPPQSPTKRKVVSSKTSITKKSSSASSTSTTVSRTSKSLERVCLADISTKITKAVRTQPRSSSLGSRMHPTWHEKILMYDPIVLEDFTAWLNTEGLGLVGEDLEIGTSSVREWCESKGICCCWKKNASW
ncbi:unnamed protein product [Penicillium olsonii]|nr:unnamed protein product [Penicillium olsonii]